MPAKLVMDTEPLIALNSHQGMNGFRDPDTTIPRRPLPQIGVRAYGVAAIIVGAVGFAWGDFATNWQRVGPNAPYGEALAYSAAALETIAGLAMLWRRTARSGALLLTILYSIFTLLWVIQVCSVPLVYDGWGNVFEELSLVIGGATAFASLAPAGSRWAGKSAFISRGYGVCPISFALVHLLNLAGVATWVPKWIPPGQMFWAITTAICFLLAAAAILSGIQAHLAALLLTAELMGFEILVWVPKLIADPHSHFTWAGNAISLAMVAAAWVVSDALNEPGGCRRMHGLQFSDTSVTTEAQRNGQSNNLHSRRKLLQQEEAGCETSWLGLVDGSGFWDINGGSVCGLVRAQKRGGNRLREQFRAAGAGGTVHIRGLLELAACR